MVPLTPEQHLLLTTIQSNPNADEIAAALHGTIDWDGFIALAGMHGVLPIVYRTFHALQPVGLPRETMALMQKKYHQNAMNSLRLLNLLFKTLAQFQKHNIAAFPFRGPVLSHMLYGDAAVRQCGDLDLIIRRADLEKAKAVLLKDGYEIIPKRTPRQEAHYIKYFYSLTFLRERDHAMIDLHWNIASPAFSRYFNFDAIGARSQTITISDHTIPVFCASDWILCLSIHAAKHMWSRLLWLQDIHQLLAKEKSNVDLQQIINLSLRTNDFRSLMITLLLCRRLWDSETLNRVENMAPCTDKAMLEMVDNVMKHLFAQHDYLESAMWKNIISRKTLNHVTLQKGWRAKMNYIWNKAKFRLRIG